MDAQVRKGTGLEVLLNIAGNDIRKGTGLSVLLNIHENEVRKGTGSSAVLNVSGNNIRAGSGLSVICNIRGNEIRKGSGLTILFNINANSIRKGTGNSALYNTTRRLNVVELAAALYALGEISADRSTPARVVKVNSLKDPGTKRQSGQRSSLQRKIDKLSFLQSLKGCYPAAS
jgi:hypothetical protein